IFTAPVFPRGELAGWIRSGYSMLSASRRGRQTERHAGGSGRGRRLGRRGLTPIAEPSSRAAVPVLRRVYAPLITHRVYLSKPGQNRMVSIKRVDGRLEPLILSRWRGHQQFGELCGACPPDANAAASSDERRDGFYGDPTASVQVRVSAA